MLGATKIGDVQNQVQKYWAPLGASQLVQTNKFANVINRDYENTINEGGDTVYVSVYKPMTASKKTIGVDADTYTPSKVQLVRTPIVADTVIEHSIELGSLAQLQSQLDIADSKLRSTMIQAISDKLNAHLYSYVKSSFTDGTDGDSGVATLDKSTLKAARLYAGQKKWARDGNWFAFLDPSYWSDLLVDSTLASVDYVGETPIASASEFRKLLDFNCTEDNSLPNTTGLAFHRDFLYLVMQKGMTWKVSDLHSSLKRGFLLSAEIVVGAKLNQYAGNDLHWPICNSSWVAPT